MEVYKLIKSIKDGDETMTELNLDFESLGLYQFEGAKKIYKMKFKRQVPHMPELDKNFGLILISYACKVAFDTLQHLGLQDIMVITMKLTNFLYPEDLDQTETEEMMNVSTMKTKSKVIS